MTFGLLYEIEKVQPWDEDSHRNAFAEALEQIKLAQGIDQLILLVQHGATPHEAITESLRRFGEEVIPQFRHAEGVPSGAATSRDG